MQPLIIRQCFFQTIAFLIFSSLLIPCVGYSVTTAKKEKITIAIIDSGADLNHSYLRNHLWQNPGETGLDSNGRDKATNKIDDDGNGFVDDVHGWDFVKGDSKLADEDGHGTHIAGVIKKVITEKAPQALFEFVVLKYFQSKHEGKRGNYYFYLSALRYAIDSGADVINISGGGYKSNSEELSLLKRANQSGILVVAAAGNKSQQLIHNRPFYPAAYDLPNIVSVAATDAQGVLLKTSNLNITRKNHFAPGDKIYSSLPGDSFGYRTGSSQAAAALTGSIVAKRLLAAP